MRIALATGLFRAAGEGRFEPIHRHLAEFLAGRFLARLVENNHPMRRILALITGSDGGVATSLRGLSAWFATLCPQARTELIRRDPIGVGHYGDVRQFSTSEKTDLISSLHREISNFGLAWNAEIAFGPLVSNETEIAIIELLDTPNPGPTDNRAIEFVLRLIQETPRLPKLATALLGAITDANRPPYVRQSALAAYVRNCPESIEKSKSLQRLLLQISTGDLADPVDEMRGQLLASLYPQTIGADDIWSHVQPGNHAIVGGQYWNFWERDLVRLSGANELPVLLDRLSAPEDELLSRLHARGIWSMPTRLLAKSLNRCGETVSPERLHRWLSTIVREAEDPYTRQSEETSSIRDWIESHPRIQLAVCLECLQSWSSAKPDPWLIHTYRSCLFGADRPQGYGAWCLAQVAAFADEHPLLARVLFEEAIEAFRGDHAKSGITEADLNAFTDNHEFLVPTLKRLLEDPPNPVSAQSSNRLPENDTTDPEHQAWLNYLREERSSLVSNRAGLNILYDLGRAAFGFMRYQSPGGSPRRQLELFLDADEDLVDSAITALRGAPLGSEVPDVAVSVRLKSLSKMPTISYAVLAGLDLIEEIEPESIDELSDDQVRNAIAIYFCVPTGRSTDPNWFRHWANSRIDLVAEVMIDFLISEFRERSEHISQTYQLACDAQYVELARRVTIPLLRAFPIRCNLRQIKDLKYLLQSALKHCNRTDLAKLACSKVRAKSMLPAPRVNWLAFGVLIDSKEFLPELDSYVRGNHARTKHLVEYLEPVDRGSMSEFEFDAQTLRTTIELIGAEFRPRSWNGWVTTAEWASDIVDKLISQLRSDPGEPAAQALAALATNETLTNWAERLEFARSEQSVLRRDALYKHPAVAATNAALRQGRPANVADLAAMVDDFLSQIGQRIRTGDTNDWHQYWNEPEGDLRPTSKREDLCRDALLSDLRQLLPAQVQAEREGSYAFDKRSDIKVTFDEFNLPIEIKKQSHRDLWSAIHDQLIANYTFDSATGGFGIYLVFWFGADERIRVGANGHRPRSPQELKRQLIASLSDDELDRIYVHVVDVSRSRL
ncbi:MAG: hypothetical protein OXL33_04710 [Chloroflexota bacterium]|nr:hypothetical protein [Chloroflexota bacterium]